METTVMRSKTNVQRAAESMDGMTGARGRKGRERRSGDPGSKCAGDWFTPRILITKNYKALFFFLS